MTKICNHCTKEQVLSEFVADKRYKLGVIGTCRSCDRTKRAARRKLEAYRIKANDRQHRSRYGLTSEQRDVLLRAFRVCVACGIGVNLCVDHDHKTKEIRGVLCQRCNRAMGLLNDDPVKLQALVDYLTAPNLLYRLTQTYDTPVRITD